MYYNKTLSNKISMSTESDKQPSSTCGTPCSEPGPCRVEDLSPEVDDETTVSPSGTPTMTTEQLKDQEKKNEENRRVLKAKVLQLQAEKLQEKIDKAMQDVEDMCQKYADIMNELNTLNGLNTEQKVRHDKLLSKMMGDVPGQTAENTAKSTSGLESMLTQCNTTEDMLAAIQHELTLERGSGGKPVAPPPGVIDGHTIEQKDILDAADQIANLPENEAIWDRIAKAHAELEMEKNKTFTASTSPLETVKEVCEVDKKPENNKEDEGDDGGDSSSVSNSPAEENQNTDLTSSMVMVEPSTSE